MKNNTQNSMLRGIKRTGRRVVRGAVIGVILGGFGGALFGGVFAAFWLLVRQDPWQIASMAGYFGLCGVAAGVVVGTYAAMADAQESPEAEYSFPNVANPMQVADRSACKVATAGRSFPRNRLSGIFDAERRRRETLTANDPSQN